MRKPASDVAGIEEVNTKQDKIGYTPADDSKVVHDNHNNTIKANNVNYDLSKSGLTSLIYYGSGSFNNLPLGTVLADGSSMTDGPNSSNAFITTTFYSSQFGGHKAQIAINTFTNNMYFRSGLPAWNNWVSIPDDSQLVHKSGDEEISGQKTFNVTPIDQTTGNPYITKDGVPNLPPNIARTGKAQTFTVAQTFSIAPTITDASRDKEDNQAAVMADLKRVENSAWHMMSGSSEALKTYNCWFKINKDKKRLEIIVLGVTNKMSYSDTRVTNEMGYFDTRVTNKMGYFDTYTILDLSNIITNISRFSGYFNIFGSGASGPESSDVSYSILTDGARAKVSNVAAGSNLAAQIISDEVYSDSGTGNPAYVYYDDLQDAYK